MKPAWAENAGLSHFSPSQLNIPIASWVYKYVYLNGDQRRQMRAGAKPFIGTICHDAVQSICIGNRSVDDSVTRANSNYIAYTPLDDADNEVYETNKPLLGEYVNQAMSVLTNMGEFNYEDELPIKLYLPDIELPITGFIDLVGNNRVIELKTKIRSKAKRKAPIPSNPDPNHVLQVACYWKATGLKPTLIYFSDAGVRLFDESNSFMLEEHALEQALEDARHRALVRQNLLKISTDPNVLAGLVIPDWNSYEWNIDPEFLPSARRLFNV